MEKNETDGLSLLPVSAQKTVCWLLILVAGSMAAGRLASVTQLYDPTLFRAVEERNSKRAWINKKPIPVVTLSSNDRSRWLTVRALLENGTFVIGQRPKGPFVASACALVGMNQPFAIPLLLEAGKLSRIKGDTGLLFEEGWNSIDRVLKPDSLEYYSSKPPLFPTLLAGWTWVLQKATGWTLKEQPAAIIRISLVAINIIPFCLYLLLFASIVFRLTESGWVRILLVTAAAFGTLVTPFLITLNNHTPAVFLVTFALWAVLGNNLPSVWKAFLAGASSGLAFTMELPALSFFAVLLVLWLDWRQFWILLIFLISALSFMVALAALNWISIGSFLPAYSEFGGPWYDYEGSPWNPFNAFGDLKRNIDFARRNMGETRPEYAFHLLIGHHGLFSLTPLFLLSLLGGFQWLVKTRGFGLKTNSLFVKGNTCSTGIGETQGRLAITTLGLTVIVVGFYLFKSDNYGGMSCGPRWLIWLSPLLLLCTIPALERLNVRKNGRILAYFFLAVGVFSASWPAWSPWKLPWIYDLLVWWGWSGYA